MQTASLSSFLNELCIQVHTWRWNDKTRQLWAVNIVSGHELKLWRVCDLALEANLHAYQTKHCLPRTSTLKLSQQYTDIRLQTVLIGHSSFVLTAISYMFHIYTHGRPCCAG